MRSELLLLFLFACKAPEVPFTEGLPCESEAGIGEAVSYEADTMLCVQIDMDGAEFDELAQQQRFGDDEKSQWNGVIHHVLSSCVEPFPDPYTWFEADISVEGEALERVGVRKKGFIGSALIASRRRPSLKLKLDRNIEGQQLGDTERITLNNNLSDGSRIRTCLTYSIFEDAGYPAPRCNLANVMMNGVSLGAYTHVEGPKKRFLRRVFSNDEGSLYEATVADFTTLHLDGSGMGRWEAKTSDTDTSGALLEGVAAALQADDADLEAALDAVIDLDRYLQFWALETLVAHQDGYAGNTNNTYVYFDPDDADRAVFIPWGPDDALGSERVDYTTGALPYRLARVPALYDRYLVELDRLLEEVYDEEVLIERVEKLTELAATAEGSDQHRSEAEELVEWLNGRRARLREFIDAGGMEVEEREPTCSAGIAAEDLTATGELLVTVVHGCSTGPRPGGLGDLLRRR